ncbi:MAG: HipA N-terminal domain-containing protein [Bacteroidales bacterium]
MKEAYVFVNGTEAGRLCEVHRGRKYKFTYHPWYAGPAVSLTLPVRKGSFVFHQFPPFFEGLLPEGHQLQGLLRTQRLEKDDYFEQLMAVGHDPLGHVTLLKIEP